MGRKTLERQVIHALSSKMAIGQSRRQAKADMRAELGSAYRFGMPTPGIHSYRTRETYQDAALRFVRWCVVERGVDRHARLEGCKELAPAFLQHRRDSGKSVYTLTTERSALGKLFGEPVDFPIGRRTPDTITRSRGQKAMDAHFSEERNENLVTFALGTGCRREDAANACITDCRTIGGHLFVEFRQSKGGKDRIAPVLPGMEKEVAAVISKAGAVGREKVFDHIHTKMDVHSYRRRYAQALYNAVAKDPALLDELLKVYPPRYEPNVRSDTYKPRRQGQKCLVYQRDCLYIVSRALGHNRLDVVVTHYLT